MEQKKKIFECHLSMGKNHTTTTNFTTSSQGKRMKRINKEKCHYFDNKHKPTDLEREGIRSQHEKTMGIKDASKTENTEHVRAFLGTVNCHAKLVQVTNQLCQTHYPECAHFFT